MSETGKLPGKWDEIASQESVSTCAGKAAVVGNIAFEVGKEVYAKCAEELRAALALDAKPAEGDVERELREEWAFKHGCDPAGIYGDDGELHCNICMTDFKRIPLPELRELVMLKRAAATPASDAEKRLLDLSATGIQSLRESLCDYSIEMHGEGMLNYVETVELLDAYEAVLAQLDALRKALDDCATELEKVWKSDGMKSDNRWAVAAREALRKEKRS